LEIAAAGPAATSISATVAAQVAIRLMDALRLRENSRNSMKK
jgi:hypothetical protein